MASSAMRPGSAAGSEPIQRPSAGEQRLLDLLEQAPAERFAAILKCIPGWQFEGQANLRHWDKVLEKLKSQLTTAIAQCPRLLVAAPPEASVAAATVATTDAATAVGDAAMGDDDAQQLTEQLYETLRFTAILLENASNKHLYNAIESVVVCMGARSERVAFEATHVVAALALPPQQHRHAVDPMAALVDLPASNNTTLRRRLLAIAQGRGARGGMDELSDIWSEDMADVVDLERLVGATTYQFYRHVPNASDELVAVTLDQRQVEQLSLVSDSLVGDVCEQLIDQACVPSEHQFQLLVRIRGVACAARQVTSSSSREVATVEKLHALVALFHLFSDSLDVASLVEHNASLARGLTDLIRIEKNEDVPLRVRITALQVLSALVYDRAERGGAGGVLGRQSNVLQALGVAKGAPHGVFPSLVRYVLSELGQVPTRASATASLADVGQGTEPDNDMDMSLAVAFVQATTEWLTPEDAQVLRTGLFRDPQDTKLCWFEAALVLLNQVVSMQSGAAVLTESGVIPALLHVASTPALSAFHTSQITLCVQALELTVNTHPAAAALFRDLNGVGIIIDRLHAEVYSVDTPTPVPETRTVLMIALLVMLSVSFHSQGVMSAGATSRVIRDGSPLSKTLLQILGHVDTYGPVVFAQAAIVVSDIVNNDPSSVNQVHAGGIADAFLKTITRWNVSELRSSNILPPSSELIMAIPSVLSALCLTSAHAEKVARCKPLLYVLDCFAMPSYAADDCDHLQGDVAAIVGSGIFEIMRQVAGFQTAAIHACVETAKKLVRFCEENQGVTNALEHQANAKVLLRMTTHFSDVLEPILSKSEHASSFADHGGVVCLLQLCRSILPTANVFFSSLMTTQQGARSRNQRLRSTWHQQAAQSLTMALRSFASQQPTKMLNVLMAELGRRIDEWHEQRATVDGLFSALQDAQLAELFGYDAEGAAGRRGDRLDEQKSHEVQVVGRDIRLLAFIEWLVGLLSWSMQAAQSGLQSRHWFSELLSRTNSATLDKLFALTRSIQLERAKLVGVHRRGDKSDTSTSFTAAGLWKLCSLLLLRFSSATRSLLVAMSKTLVSVPIQHRRGDESLQPLAVHAQNMAKFIAKSLRDHVQYGLSGEESLEPFVKKYYLVFVLETMMQTVFDAKKKHANALVLFKLLATPETSSSSCVHAMLSFLSHDCVSTVSSTENTDTARMQELCVRVCANALQHLADLETVRTSPITLSLVASEEGEPASAADRAGRFDLRSLSVQLHRECLDVLVRLWQHPQLRLLSVQSYAQELLPAVVMVLRHRLDRDVSNPASGTQGFPARSPFEQLRQGGQSTRGRHDFASAFGDFPGAGSSILDREDFLQALFGGEGHAGTRLRTTANRPFEVDSATVDSLVAMGFPRSRVERAIRRVRLNDVEVVMEYLLSHPDAGDDDNDEEEQGTENEANTEIATPREEEGSAVASEQDQHSEEEAALFQQYRTLRESLEEGCFAMLRHQTSLQQESREISCMANAALQTFVVTLAQYFAVLCSKMDDERQQIIARVTSALVNAMVSKTHEPDGYVVSLSHVLAVLLQLDPVSVATLTTQTPSFVVDTLNFIRTSLCDEEQAKMKESYTPLLLVIDALNAGTSSASQQLTLSDMEALTTASTSTVASTSTMPIDVRNGVIDIAVRLMASPELPRNTAHALWQLLARLTLDYEVANELYAAGGLDKLLNLRAEAVFTGYKEMTSAIIVQMLESPQVLEQMMEEKIQQAMAKLTERYGPPTQMRITPRVLMMEVATVAARSEKLFAQALKKTVVFKKTESGRVYVLNKTSDPATPPAAAEPSVSASTNDDHHHAEKKAPHKLPKLHRQHAHAVVQKLMEKIRAVWLVEKALPEVRSAEEDDVTRTENPFMLGVGTYLHLLVQVITTFPACAAVIIKNHHHHASSTPSDHHEHNFVHLVLRELLPSKSLCRFATVRRSLEVNGLEDDAAANDILRPRDALTLRTRERLKNAHKLLVVFGTQPGDGPKLIVGELVKLFQEWPHCVVPSASLSAEDLSVDDEVALSALHAWSALIMSILWPRGAASKTLSWDKIVLGGGLKGKYAFVTLLMNALRKISLSHPFAFATCSMVLRPLTTLTRPFVTHRVKKLLMKRTSSSGVSGGERREDEEMGTQATSGAIADPAHSSSMELESDNSFTHRAEAATQVLATEGDVTMHSPRSAPDHDMHDVGHVVDDESDVESDRSSLSGESMEDLRRDRDEREHDEGEDDEEDEEEDEEDGDDDDDDDDDDDEDDDDEDEEGDEDDEMDEEEGRIRLRVIRRHHESSSRSRATTSSRTWGSLDNEGGDGFDEVDEEEFSYLRLLDEEAVLSNQVRAARARQAARIRATARDGDTTPTSGSGSASPSHMRSLVDLFSVDGGISPRDSPAGVFAFGDEEDEEDDPDMAFRHGGGSGLREPSALRFPADSAVGNNVDSVGSGLLNLLDDRPGNTADSDFIFETVGVAGVRTTTSSRRANGVDELSGTASASSMLHPLLRYSESDATGRAGSGGLASLLPDRLPLPRHAPSLFRELNVLVRQMNTNLHTTNGARNLVGRDLLRHGGVGGGRHNRPPSRNRLSAVSNLLSEFSLDIPTSVQGVFGHGRAGHHRHGGGGFALRRADRELLGGGGRNARGDATTDVGAQWTGHTGAVDARAIATRLEQFATQLVEPDLPASTSTPADQPAQLSVPPPQPPVGDVPSSSDDGAVQSESVTANENVASGGEASITESARTGEEGASNVPGSTEVASDTASVLALASTLGESSLRSPNEELGSESEMSTTSPVLSASSALPVETSTLSGVTMPPPAPTTATPPSADLMNFTLDLSSFQQPTPPVSEATVPPPAPMPSQAPASSNTATEEEMKSDDQQGEHVGGFVCPEGVDPEVFAFLPPEMQAEIVAQHAPPAAAPPSQHSTTAQASVTSGGSEGLSQLELDMANSSFDRETLEALPPDIRAEVLANERREREEAARAAAAPADISRAEEMDNASFVASLTPGLREEILTTCDDAFLQTLPSQVQAEAMVLRERAAYRPAFEETVRRHAGHGTTATGGDDESAGDIFRRPTLRRMLTSQGPDIFSAAARRSGGRHGRDGSRRGREDRHGLSVRKPGMIRVPREEDEAPSDRILDDKAVQAIVRLLFMAQSVVQNRVVQRLLTNVCAYPLTRDCVRGHLLRILSASLDSTKMGGAYSQDDLIPTGLYGASLTAATWSTTSRVPPEILGRVFMVMTFVVRHNARFAVEMLGSPVEAARDVSILVDLLQLPAVRRSSTLLESLLELLELVLLPLDQYDRSETKMDDAEEEKKENEDDAASSTGDYARVPAIHMDAQRVRDVVSVLALSLCSPSMQERTIQILKLLDRVPANRPLIMQALVEEGKRLVAAERFRSHPTSSRFEASAVLQSAQDELTLLRILHSLSDVCETTADFNECSAAIGLDTLWDALSRSLDDARVGSSGALESSGARTSDTAVIAPPAGDDVTTVIEGKSAGASIAMAALLARFLPMVEAFFVVSARDAASMPLRVPDSAEREEAMVLALREGGLETKQEADAAGPTELRRLVSSSSAASASEAGADASSIRLAQFVEANRVLLNLLVREKPSLLDSSLAALVKLPRCRAYLDFDNKRTYFQSAMKKLRQTALRSQVGNAAVRLSVRRDHIFEDSYYALRMRSGAELRRKLHVAFTNEEGIDAGGVTREWYVILAREIFNPNYVLFTSAADSPTFQPNPLSYVNKDHLSYFEFVGKVMGKAVADGQLLDAHFTRSFYKHILQLPISYHDMEAIDPEYYRNLHSILDNPIEALGLELTFSADQSNFGRVEIVDLIPNGRHIAVTDDNKMEYVKLVTHHRMATGIRQQIDAFLKGFHQLVPPELISIFNENELELLISGMPEIDIDDLKANTDYANYKPTDPVIRWFWNVLYACTQEERALFLQFVTGTSKVPLEGFKALEGMRGTHKFNIHKAFGNPNALPSAHTCFNQLDLPEYESEDKLRQCLLLAIREGSEGFGFG